jgi:putative FmdB family regulatory protein
MPIYEFECNICKNRSEKLQKYSDPSPICADPECHENEMTRLISAGGFELKGTGWYATDFKGKHE